MTKSEFNKHCETHEADSGVTLQVKIVHPFRDLFTKVVTLSGVWANGSICDRELYRPNKQWTKLNEREQRLEEARVKYLRWLDEFQKQPKKDLGISLLDNQVIKLCEYLRATTKTLDEALEHLEIRSCGEFVLEENLSSETLRKIDDRVFLCAHCGWWFEIEEESEVASRDSELVCRECGADDKQETEDE